MEKLKIGIVSPPFLPVVTDMSGYGGTERVVAELAKGLADRGHSVTLFAPEGSKVAANVKIVTTGRHLWSTKYEITKDDIENGMKRTLDITYRNASRLDIIHFNLDESLTDKRFDSIPTINTIHGDTASLEIKARYAKSNNRPLAFISKSQEAMIHGTNSVGVVYNGINTKGFTPSYKPGDYVVFLGRVSMEKGMHVAIDVAMEANIKLVAMYREPIRDKSDSIANADWEYYNHYVKPRFEMYNGAIQHIIDPEVKVRDNVLRGALALLGPSGSPPSTWSEPFGLFVAESMASGTPAIVYNKGGPAEIVADGRTGYVAKSLDERSVVHEMAGAVGMVRDAGPAMRMESRERVEGTFSTEKMAEGYESAYFKVLLRKMASAGSSVLVGIISIPRIFREQTMMITTNTSGSYFRDIFSQSLVSNIMGMIPNSEIPYIIGVGLFLSIYLTLPKDTPFGPHAVAKAMAIVN
ncbi:MAG: glycosyltransferase [Candidatus Micrarchaeaceae archaeon]